MSAERREREMRAVAECSRRGWTLERVGVRRALARDESGRLREVQIPDQGGLSLGPVPAGYPEWAERVQVVVYETMGPDRGRIVRGLECPAEDYDANVAALGPGLAVRLLPEGSDAPHVARTHRVAVDQPGAPLIPIERGDR
jgi:hypothetical protein